ncbi:hypothetical protein [Dethiosulfovibrio salsuginis]|uniref:Uncharacterized protein n=1 Tax=Dethiosulfovibrio salsuginis TaxID=561720 RepID=A0A1X7IMD3_9BACT|nr:hypothetical protein [Dethiosulfovibrio salsuginis]SMG16108.1 hypothetical protein SAMN06275492_10394 [Dethiosulfovibrio salsuginis]
MNKMVRKVASVVGFCGALWAAEGLNRFGGLVAAFGGEDTPFYIAFLLIAVAAAGVFILSLFKDVPSPLKWVICVGLFGSAGLVLMGPALPVNEQILFGLTVAALATFALPTSNKKKESVVTITKDQEKPTNAQAK